MSSYTQGCSPPLYESHMVHPHISDYGWHRVVLRKKYGFRCYLLMSIYWHDVSHKHVWQTGKCKGNEAFTIWSSSPIAKTGILRDTKLNLCAIHGTGVLFVDVAIRLWFSIKIQKQWVDNWANSFVYKMLVAMDLRQEVLLFFNLVTWLRSMASHIY